MSRNAEPDYADTYFELSRALRQLDCADRDTLREVLVGILSSDESLRARATGSDSSEAPAD
jgi:hypothetical protein